MHGHVLQVSSTYLAAYLQPCDWDTSWDVALSTHDFNRNVFPSQRKSIEPTNWTVSCLTGALPQRQQFVHVRSLKVRELILVVWLVFLSAREKEASGWIENVLANKWHPWKGQCTSTFSMGVRALVGNSRSRKQVGQVPIWLHDTGRWSMWTTEMACEWSVAGKVSRMGNFGCNYRLRLAEHLQTAMTPAG